MPDIQTKIRLAREFGSQMQAELSRADFRQAVDRNKAEPDNSGICHTHDFCDANMIMESAFVACFAREPDLNSDSDLELWNEAWSIAIAADFFA